ncbi:MAG: helix-turn-helix domain-containing protein [Eubacterium sp.]|nr:helix-turn-helix domain-containing protein [Eubacterium sp.]
MNNIIFSPKTIIISSRQVILVTDTKTEFINSVNLNAGSDFPYLVLDVVNEQSYPRNPGFQVMHWHEDIQFIYVFEGEIEIKTLTKSISVDAGSGVFINKNVVHLVRKNSACHYNSFIFPDYFLKFYFGSPAKDFVESIIGKEQIPICCFSRKTENHRTILNALKRLSEIEKNKTDFYVYEVLVSLTTLWLEVRKNIQFPSEKQDIVVHARMQKFLQYIEQHFGEDVSLEVLAASANVSKSECLRCFKSTMQSTPYKYLIEYRLSKAAELLKNTDESISNIAECVGFHQISHFGKCFKEKTGLAPRDYRNRK